MKEKRKMNQMVMVRRNLIQMKIMIGVIILIPMKNMTGVIILIPMKNMTGVKKMIMIKTQHLIVMMMGKPHLIIMRIRMMRRI